MEVPLQVPELRAGPFRLRLGTFKDEWHSADSSWHWYYHQGDTGTYVGAGSTSSAGFSQGYSVGETSVYDLDDGASDHHYHDSYAGAAGNWHD
jgi:hypothetical protein